MFMKIFLLLIAASICHSTEVSKENNFFKRWKFTDHEYSYLSDYKNNEFVSMICDPYIEHQYFIKCSIVLETFNVNSTIDKKECNVTFFKPLTDEKKRVIYPRIISRLDDHIIISFKEFPLKALGIPNLQIGYLNIQTCKFDGSYFYERERPVFDLASVKREIKLLKRTIVQYKNGTYDIFYFDKSDDRIRKKCHFTPGNSDIKTNCSSYLPDEIHLKNLSIYPSSQDNKFFFELKHNNDSNYKVFFATPEDKVELINVKKWSGISDLELTNEFIAFCGISESILTCQQRQLDSRLILNETLYLKNNNIKNIEITNVKKSELAVLVELENSFFLLKIRPNYLHFKKIENLNVSDKSPDDEGYQIYGTKHKLTFIESQGVCRSTELTKYFPRYLNFDSDEELEFIEFQRKCFSVEDYPEGSNQKFPNFHEYLMNHYPLPIGSMRISLE